MVFGVFAGTLLSCAAIAALSGGADGFRWILQHGATGPLAVVVLYDGELNAGNIPIALVLLIGAFGCVASKARWLIPLSVVSAIGWVMIGMGVGV